jgi:glycine/D-amino acid oxidase-like deaminating enzyme
VNAGLWLEPETVEQALGHEVGARLNAILADGPDLVFSLIDRHAISCEAVRNGTLHCAHSRKGLGNLQERRRQYQARGWPVRLLSAEETRTKTGTSAYHGALLDARAGTIQPLAYARGLALAAMSAGARLHERSPVLDVRRTDGGWQVTTASRRKVNAGALLLATNAYHARIAGAPPPRYTAVNWFQFATAPLPEVLRAQILPERQGCWDTATVMSAFRLDAAGRLMLGAIGSIEGPGRIPHRGWAQRKLAALFPQAAHLSFEHGWEGRIAMTSDHIPKIVALGPRAISIYGYSGRGISPGTVFGKAAAAFLSGGDEGVLPLPLREGYSEPLTRVKAAYYEAGATAFHLMDGRR